MSHSLKIEISSSVSSLHAHCSPRFDIDVRNLISINISCVRLLKSNQRDTNTVILVVIRGVGNRSLTRNFGIVYKIPSIIVTSSKFHTKENFFSPSTRKKFVSFIDDNLFRHDLRLLRPSFEPLGVRDFEPPSPWKENI